MPTTRRTFLSSLSLAAVGSAGCVTVDDGTPTGAQDRLRWRYETGGRVSSSPVLIDGQLLIGSRDGSLRSLDPSSGSLQWRFETDGGIIAGPASRNGLVFVGSEDIRLYAVDLDGNERWSFETENAVISTPSIGDGSVYFGSMDGHVYRLGVETGREEWATRIGEYVGADATVHLRPPLGGSTSVANGNT